MIPLIYEWNGNRKPLEACIMTLRPKIISCRDLFGDHKRKDSMNVGLSVASTRFTQLTSERQKELPLKGKDSNLLH